ncbi:MAG: hypothetical protein INQ03_11810 [Candidatus Heimdallarchaeota archaeon]|nr:hypothetical protein [Candidatus Heimdallarchaeota archaeon]
MDEVKSEENTEPLTEKGIIQKISRIPWKEYIRSKIKTLLAASVMLILILNIISLSRKVRSDDSINPDNVLTSSNDAIILMIISSTLYLLVMIAFSKLVFLDKREDFAIKKFSTPRAIWFFLLTISFISQVYILLDVALINVYLITGPVYFLQSVNRIIQSPLIAMGTDRIAYASVRSLVFTSLLVFNLIFPLFMFITIFTRYGRRVLKKVREDETKKYTPQKFAKFILAIPGMILLFALFSATVSKIGYISVIFLVLLLILMIWWLIQLIIIILKIIRATIILSYSNISMIIPIIFMFYILPSMVWAIWDMLFMYVYSSLDNTIYSFDFLQSQNIDPNSIKTMSVADLFAFFIKTSIYNSQSWVRIIQLDFISIIGIASLIIGFAEGYTIFAIIKSLTKGISIARTGKIVTKSAPRMVVLTRNVLFLFTWISLLWDKGVSFMYVLIVDLGFDLPELNLPRILEPIYSLTVYLGGINDVFVPLTILLIPFYFIIISSFKFLSVSIAVERTEEDNQVFFLLISSTFVLIITKIFSDIATLPEFVGNQKDYLPLSIFSNENILDFIMKITEILETIGFFAGFLFSLKSIYTKLIRKGENEIIIEEGLENNEEISQ